MLTAQRRQAIGSTEKAQVCQEGVECLQIKSSQKRSCLLEHVPTGKRRAAPMQRGRGRRASVLLRIVGPSITGHWSPRTKGAAAGFLRLEDNEVISAEHLLGAASVRQLSFIQGK